MTDISPVAAAARETARTTSGQFGTQEHSEPELKLMGPYEPGQPVYATVSFEEYLSEHDEHPVHVAEQKVDIAGILDTLPLDQVEHLRDEAWPDADFIVYELQKQGGLTHPSFPFSIDLDAGDLDAYADYRAVHEQAEPLAETATPAIENLVAAVAAQQGEIDKLHDLLAEAQAEKEAGEERIIRAIALAAHPTAATIAVQLDHPRYPVEVYDQNQQWVNIGEEGELALAEEIRKHLGNDPAVVGGRGTARAVMLHPSED